MGRRSQNKAAPRVYLKLFGDCRLILDGRPVQGVPTSLFRLAAYLILAGNGGVQPRHRVRSLLWSATDQDKAAANMRQALARIRQLQEAHDFRLIEITNSTLQWLATPNVECDLSVFAGNLDGSHALSAVELCALYDGELLAGLAPGGEDFEEWVGVHREKFAVHTVDRLAASISIDNDLTAADRGICARHLLELDPYNEGALRVLMQEAAGHRQTARLAKLYESMRTVLDHELGVQPAPETQTLYKDLMAKVKAV